MFTRLRLSGVNHHLLLASFCYIMVVILEPNQLLTRNQNVWNVVIEYLLNVLHIVIACNCSLPKQQLK